MKQKLLCGLMALALAPAAFSQPSYENDGAVICPPDIPPTIDTTNFVNYGLFVINYTNEDQTPAFSTTSTTPPFETSDTLYYTNGYGAVMSCNAGFDLETFPSGSGQSQWASTLYNNGTIDCGTNVYIIEDVSGTGGVTCTVNATNIYNPGTINMGYDGLLSLRAENIDLTRGTLAMENFGFNSANGLIFFNGGFFDGYWGLGRPWTNLYPTGINPDAYYDATPPFTQYHIVTNRDSTVNFFQQLGGVSFTNIYLLDVTDFTGSNRTVRAVFLSNTNPLITANVYLQSYYPYAMDPDWVEFSAVITNYQGITTNYLYIEDSFLYDPFFLLDIDGYAGAGYNRPTFIPDNYTFYEGGLLDLGTPTTRTTIPPGTFDVGGTVTNQYSAYQALFQPGSVILADTAGQNVTNEPGRIEVTADKYLTLPLAQISSVSYILLKATNHFAGSSGAQIAAPFADVYLRSTNGLLNLTNVLVPSLPRPIGICDLFSARWTNMVAGVTNRFHVLFVDAQYAPSSPLMIQTLNLWATNGATHDDSILISDVFNVTSNLLIDTRRLTLTTNAPGAPTPVGILNYLNPAILWPAATPRLQYLTNYGVIECANFAVFGGSQTSPYSSPANSTNPYAAFVNAGVVTNFGCSIFTAYFQNGGVFLATGGAIQLLQAQTAILTNGAFLAPGTPGAITIQGGSLLVSNHVLQAGAALTLSVTNYLDDGSLTNSVETITNKNIWNAGNGMNLPILPPQASLLATTITNTAAPSVNTINQWAGRDYGCQPGGFVNNAALGRLILDGKTNTSQFTFLRAGLTNALYVDLLEFQDATVNFVSGSLPGTLDFVGVNLATNFTIYYGDAIVNSNSIAELLNGCYGVADTNGGRFRWVSNYNTGFFSSTNVVYTDGSVHQLNRALVYSCDINSNGQPYPPTDGFNAANCSGPGPIILKPDPVPALTPSTLVLTVGFTNHPARSVVLSWDTLPLASNYLYSSSSLLQPGTNWQLVTNFLSDATIGGRANVTYPISTNGALYYRVGVQSP
ncbi:MAG: hypothetical protein ABSD29_04870 [Verrucomicrobiota bacterium]|jgi:hypothetical protein